MNHRRLRPGAQLTFEYTPPLLILNNSTERRGFASHETGVMSWAYTQIFTLSYVTGHSVGIGAYLNRLTQRVIQKEGSPLILTGFAALNKVKGHHRPILELMFSGGRDGCIL